MGLFDMFTSPEKQFEKERKLLEKPDHAVAIVTSYQDWDSSECVTLEDGCSDVRSVRMQQASFKFKLDGEWVEYEAQPREGSGDFAVGEQWIVKYNKHSGGIVGMDRQLRDDSPNRIAE